MGREIIGVSESMNKVAVTRRLDREGIWNEGYSVRDENGSAQFI